MILAHAGLLLILEEFSLAKQVYRKKARNMRVYPQGCGIWIPTYPALGFRAILTNLAHQNRTIAIASDFRVDEAKSPEIPQKEGVLGSEIADR